MLSDLREKFRTEDKVFSRGKPQSRFYRLAGLLLFLGILFPGAARGASSELLEQSGQAETGRPAPWFSGWTLDQQVFNIDKPFKNPKIKRVALVFFTTKCLPCLKGMDFLKHNRDRLIQAGVYVALINYKESRDLLVGYFRKHPSPFTVVVDAYGQMETLYLNASNGTVELPRTVVIGPDRKVIKIIGIEREDYLSQLLD